MEMLFNRMRKKPSPDLLIVLFHVEHLCFATRPPGILLKQFDNTTENFEDGSNELEETRDRM